MLRYRSLQDGRLRTTLAHAPTTLNSKLEEYVALILQSYAHHCHLASASIISGERNAKKTFESKIVN